MATIRTLPIPVLCAIGLGGAAFNPPGLAAAAARATRYRRSVTINIGESE